MLYFDQLCSRNRLLNKLDNHFTILYLFYLQNLNKIEDSEICIGFHLSSLDDLTGSERDDCFFMAYRYSWTLDAGLWTLDAGLWALDSGRWTLDFGRWTLDATFRKVGSGL